MIDKAKFRAEIERRKGVLENVDTSNSEVAYFYEGKAKAYNEVLDLIDATQEESVCEDFKKEVNRYFWKEICNNKDIRLHYDYLFLIAKHFVEWQKEQMMRDATEAFIRRNRHTRLNVLSGLDLTCKAIQGFKDGDKLKVIFIKED